MTHAPRETAAARRVYPPRLRVDSEVGKLLAVLLHRPGPELNNLTPAHLERLLFDEIPWLDRAREEHYQFARLLAEQGVAGYYVEDLIQDVLVDPTLRREFVAAHLEIGRLSQRRAAREVAEYLLSLPLPEMVGALIAGVPKRSVGPRGRLPGLANLTSREYPFYLEPLPSMYFTRDHGAMVRDRLLISTMANAARRRETLFLRFLLHHHPLFRQAGVEPLFPEPVPGSVEGGDVHVLGEDTLLLGLSERTEEDAIEWIAQRLLAGAGWKRILVLQIPARRAYMHLDTVFTMIDRDKFLIYPGVEDAIRTFCLEPGPAGSVWAREEDDLKAALRRALGAREVLLIRSGGDDPIAAAREQWCDSTNTLAVAPGVVVTYNRNRETNRILRRHGIEVLEFDGSELVRGRGGPRCMSLPLLRAPLEEPSPG